MKAIVAAAHGGPEVLEITEVDTPQPGPGQLLVEVAAVGVNFIETYQREGIYPTPLPFTPGAESSGVVVALGKGVTGFTVGDRVASAEGAQSYAEYTLIDADKALRVPEGLALATAAALPLQGITAHYLVNSAFAVQSGNIVLIHAGAGGVGLLVIQLLKAKGATVITTVSNDEKAALASQAGADHVLRYSGFAAAVRELTGGRGVDAVYDGVGKDTFDGSLDSLKTRGTLVLYGAASGPVPPFDIQRLNRGGSLFLTRPSMAAYLLDAEERRWRAEEIFDAVVGGSLSVRIGASYPLEEAAQAHRDLQGRKTTGKVLLKP